MKAMTGHPVSEPHHRPLGPEHIPERRTDWLRYARCAEPGVDPEWFYLDAPNERERLRVHEKALRFCRECPVMMECRLDGDHREGEGAYVYGVLGGETPRDRRRRRFKYGRLFAGVAQEAERDLAKVEVAGSTPAVRSRGRR